jgi:hypothetical protein
MGNKWMGYHLDTVRPGSRKNIKAHLRHAQSFFLNRNVKDLRYGDFEDFIQTLTLSEKTKHNIMSTIHHFYSWMKRRQEIASLPDFPVISFELGYRRTVGGLKGVAAGQPFGEKYFYKWWVKACSNLGIEGVDLYGGTRHSSVRALRRYRTPEEIKEAAMSATNKAFERYMGQANDGDILSIYRQSAEVIPLSLPDTAVIPGKTT